MCVHRTDSEFKTQTDAFKLSSLARTWHAGEHSAHTPLLLPSWIQNQDMAGKDMLSSVYTFFICSHWNREHNAETKHLFLIIYTSYLTPVQLSTSLIQLFSSYPSGSHNPKKLDWSSEVQHINWSTQEIFCPCILKIISNFHHVLLRSTIM